MSRKDKGGKSPNFHVGGSIPLREGEIPAILKGPDSTVALASASEQQRYVIGDWSTERQGFKLLDTQLPIESHVIGYIPIASEAYRVRDTLNRAPSKPQLEAERIENATNVGICAHHGVKTFANAVRIREGIRAGIEAYIRSQPSDVYIVGQIRAIARPVDGYDTAHPHIWEFIGVFNTKTDAESACRDWTYFVGGPIKTGASAPHETDPNYMPAWFPIARTEDVGALPGESVDEPQTAQPSVPVDALKSLERFSHDPPLGEDQWIDAANLDALIAVHVGKENG